MESGIRQPNDHDDRAAFPHIATASLAEARGFRQRVARIKNSDAPRLGVSYLLLWLTFVSCDFAFIRWIVPDRRIGSLGLLLVLAHAVVAGTSWAGLGILSTRVLRGVPLPQQPGQWFLVVLGVRLLLEVVLQSSWGDVLAATDGVLTTVTCCALVLPLLQPRLATHWKVVFCFLIVLHAAPLVGSYGAIWLDWRPATLASVLVWSRTVLSPLVPVVLSGWLAFRGSQYGWIHWLGLVTWWTWHVLHPSVMSPLL